MKGKPLQTITDGLVMLALQGGAESSVSAIMGIIAPLVPTGDAVRFIRNGNLRGMVRHTLSVLFDIGVPVDNYTNSSVVWKEMKDVSRADIIRIGVINEYRRKHIKGAEGKYLLAWVTANPHAKVTVQELRKEIRNAA